MHGYNMIEARFIIPSIYSHVVELASKASITSTNYCPDYYPGYIYMIRGSWCYRH